jgi:LmbE family N-acetylglucosaminyl deacetylase
MRITEAKKAIDFLGIHPKNHHLLKFHDADGQKYVREAIKKVKPIIKDADRIVLPSDNNSHEDHQATHDIAIKASKELELKDAEFWVYFLPTYGNWNDDSKNKQIEIEISNDLREKLLKWLQIYQSQKKLKYTWKMFTSFIEVIDIVTYGIFNYKDIGQYYNF